MLKIKKRINCNRGVALVEAAVIMPILVFAMICVAQIGVLVNAKLVIVEAAREAAREYATFHEDTRATPPCPRGVERAHIRAYNTVAQLSGPGLPRENLRITVGAGRITAEVTYPVPVFVPGAARLFTPAAPLGADFVNLFGRAVFRMEVAP
jgi:hypothetical protein